MDIDGFMGYGDMKISLFQKKCSAKSHVRRASPSVASGTGDIVPIRESAPSIPNKLERAVHAVHAD